jgi:hypothetical protein
MRIKLRRDTPWHEGHGAKKGRVFDVVRTDPLRAWIMSDLGVEIWVLPREFKEFTDDVQGEDGGVSADGRTGAECGASGDGDGADDCGGSDDAEAVDPEAGGAEWGESAGDD